MEITMVPLGGPPLEEIMRWEMGLLSVDPVNDLPAGEQLRYPRDPIASAKETINCRCIMIAIPVL